MEKSRFGLSLATDRTTYAAGEPIAIELRLFNRTGEALALHFRDAQRYDFILEDEKGNEVWRWSEGMMFAQVLGEEQVRPGREELAYSATCEAVLASGRYTLTGVLPARDSPLSASISVVVK